MPQSVIKMKELESRTGVGREAIRFYIREGMLPEPEKPKRNVAHYSENHVKRLRAIRHMQESREMSLAKIKAVLDSAEFDTLIENESLQGLERLIPALLDGVAPAPERSAGDVLADGDVTEAELSQLVERGVVSPARRQGVDWLDFRDQAILRKWGRLREAGFTRERGYDLGTLQRFKDAAEHLAAQEVPQFLAAFGDGISAEAAAEIAAEGIENANDIIAQLHIKALIRQLTEQLGRQ